MGRVGISISCHLCCFDAVWCPEVGGYPDQGKAVPALAREEHGFWHQRGLGQAALKAVALVPRVMSSLLRCMRESTSPLTAGWERCQSLPGRWAKRTSLPALACPGLCGSVHLPLNALQCALLLQHQHGKVLGAVGR